MAWAKVRKSDNLLLELNVAKMNFDTTLFTEVETFEVFITTDDYIFNPTTGSFYNVGVKKSVANPETAQVESSPFSSNKLPDGRVIHKRVTGVSTIIPANSTATLQLIVPYVEARFKGARLINTTMGDTVNFKILDDNLNTYSKFDASIATNVPLDQFGFNVYMTDGSFYETSKYAGSLFVGMVLDCEYTNNTNASKEIYMNCDIHEVIGTI